jgi:uncharacterized glyoxalase superfamily protein PhnB
LLFANHELLLLIAKIPTRETMLANRSIPSSTVIPVLAYPDVDQAVEWLSKTFGFTVRLRIASHRVQMNVGGGGHMVVNEARGKSPDATHSVMVRVEDVHQHHAHAVKCGARIVRPPEDYPYGERQYEVEDLGGHQWKFTQTLADVTREDWGGTSVEL